MLIIGIDPGISGALCFMEQGKIIDVIDMPIKIIELSSTGGTHQFSLINPKINIVRNDNLVFGVGHSSLEGFKFKLFTDKEFKN